MLIPKEIKCVIFDMDGVIIDSEPIHKKAYFETFNSIGVDVDEKLYKSFTGSSTLNAFQKLVDFFKLDLNPNDLVLIKRKRYVSYFENDPNLKLVNGVYDLIKYLHSKGIILILASSSAMVNINRVFDRFNLHQFFKEKISGADLKNSKPHPEIFEKAVKLSNCSKKSCVIIEDSDNGIKAANDADVFVFGYNNPINIDQKLTKANVIINDFSELKKLL